MIRKTKSVNNRKTVKTAMTLTCVSSFVQAVAEEKNLKISNICIEITAF
jgi:hypothetical protein